ncbi:cupin domain-containing protein [Rhizobium sp. ICMP 5592]|uniref:cupin domain-containing protein n=1 Tax=Rhizobium sp. ICMP 5592 TaxID=2292445 RepID=UPI001295BEC3|nr:cupin domain-containing protein [Rhizobium sp. ICMP 5592]MQB45876.1 cupin domain-containing protein [Rhizobium sp. ICMP 5592]
MTQFSKTLFPGEGESVQIGTTTHTTFKAVGKETDNRIGLFEHRMKPGAPGAAPHIHRHQLEAFYVLEGTVEIFINGEHVAAPAGTYIQVPEDVPHGFHNPFDKEAVMLIFFSPGQNREEYFRRLGALYANGRRASEQELIDLMADFDQFEVEYTGNVPGWGRH